MRGPALRWVLAGWCLSLAGSVQAAFEWERPGARAAGMAGAFTALADDVDALFYNPAGLAQLRSQQASFALVNLNTGLDDGQIGENRLAYGLPIKRVGTFSLGWYQRGLEGIYSEQTLQVGYGVSLDRQEDLQVGVGLKLLSQNFQGDSVVDNPFFAGQSSTSGWGIDLGALAHLNDNWSAGVSLLNLNSPNLTIDPNATSLVPMQLRLGLLYQLETLSGNMELLTYGDNLRFAAGTEIWWFDYVVGTRLGFAVGSKDLSELAAGFSLRIFPSNWGAQLDYAFSIPTGAFINAGGSHLMNFTLFWDLRRMEQVLNMPPPEPEEAEPNAEEAYKQRPQPEPQETEFVTEPLTAVKPEPQVVRPAYLERRAQRVKPVVRPRRERHRREKPVLVSERKPQATPTLAPAALSANPPADENQRKQARGAYGRGVKLMLDVDAVNGKRYFPSEYQRARGELSRIKVLLNSEDYATAIGYCEKLLPQIETLKQKSTEKDKASKALPTW